MVETICNKLTSRIRKEMPTIDDERAEVINYGLQLAFGEIPKTFIILGMAWLLKVLDLTILTIIIIMPYRAVVGGVHFKTHVKCVVATAIFYIGTALLSKYIVLEKTIQYAITIATWSFSVIMISLYAPADTEDVPILRKKERKLKKSFSYVIMTEMLVLSVLIKNTTISNILLFETLLQTISITRPMYKLAKNKYGYEEYIKNNVNLT